MRYVLMICNDEQALLAQDPATEAAMMAEYATFGDEMGARGGAARRGPAVVRGRRDHGAGARR